MSHRDRFRSLEVWSSGHKAVEHDPARSFGCRWAFVVWSRHDPDEVEVTVDRWHGTLEEFIERVRNNKYLTPVEMAGLLITLTNLGHLS